MRPATTSLILALLLLAAPAASLNNLVLIVLDDIGVDLIGAYAESNWANTPEIDDLASAGIMFRNAWAEPYCSTTRAALYTGVHSFRNFVGDAQPRGTTRLYTLANALPGYEKYLVGKWHLSLTEPGYFGWTGWKGIPNNTNPEDYFSWTKYTQVAYQNSTNAGSTTWQTEVFVDDALAYIAGATEPWLLVFTPNLIHTPHQAPPDAKHTVGAGTPDNSQYVIDTYTPGDSLGGYYDVILEALDKEVGRLIDGLYLLDTTVILVGDNGSISIGQGSRTMQGYKGSLWEGGVNVPLIAAGADVTVAGGSEAAALVHAVDVFATIVDLAGGRAPSVMDGISLEPIFDNASATVRAINFTEGSHGPADQDPSQHAIAVRNSTYKLIRFACSGGSVSYSLYNLSTDNAESSDIYGTQPAVEAALKQEILDVTGEPPNCANAPRTYRGSVSGGGYVGH